MLLPVFFCDIIKVDYHTEVFFFACSNNSVLHTLPTPVAYENEMNPSHDCSLLSSPALCGDLVNLFGKYIVCFTPKPLIQFQYSFIFSKKILNSSMRNLKL